MSDTTIGRPLAGCTALVTGAGAGIGAGIAAVLGAHGATVVVNDLVPPAAVVADVADPDAPRRLVAACLDATGRLDVVVNNAGIGNAPVGIDDLDEAAMARRWDVNVAAVLRLTRAALGPLRSSPAGRVINIGSRSWLGARGFADYSATKGAVASLTRTLALELGPDGITVNAVIPGSIVTPAFEALPDDARAGVLARHPAGRFGHPSDVGRAVAFLAAPAAGAITGQLLHVCGGRSLFGG